MSICRYCHSPITWLPRPNGSFFPPFEAEDQIDSAEYEVSTETGEFVARLVNTDLHVRLKPHRCQQYDQRHTVREEKEDVAAEDTWSLGYEAGKRSVRHRETTVKVQPTHDQWIKQAVRLSQTCSKCGAEPFNWCVYVNAEERTETKQLHAERRA